MKKSLIALAVLAASGASFAQSSVTLYGLADVWFGNVTTETAGVSLSKTRLESDGVSGSRWGLKGSEDLGGGLKANFKFEQGFALDTGAAAAGQAFSRESYVGFSGGFGEVKLGKVWTAYDDVSGASDAVFDSALSPMNSVFKSTKYNGNPGNTVYYATPAMGGFAAAASVTTGENVPGAAQINSFNLTYGAGPLAVQFGYQVEDIQNNLPTIPQDKKYMRLGATYDFGMAVAKLTYGKADNLLNQTDVSATDWQIGADFPVSSVLTVSASYAKSDDSKPAGAFAASRKGYGVAAAYTLSKRTFVYGGYRSNTETMPAGAADDKASVLAVGVQHKF